MKDKLRQLESPTKIVQILIALLMCNYMLVTIILKDFFAVKYLRDALVVFWAFLVFAKQRRPITPRYCGFFAVALAALTVVLYSADFVTGVMVTRRYLFPLAVLYLVIEAREQIDTRRLLKYLLIFFAAFAAWGVFQAYVLGDDFLMKLGYPTVYLPAYGQTMLNNSYYFGNLGIQRVVAMVSSSNICGLVLGSTLIFLGYMYPHMAHIKFRGALMCVILVGYLLTFSRSNFLAFAIVAVFLAWRFIPRRKELLIAAGAAVVLVLVVGLIQGEGGIVYKLLDWVKQSLTMSDTSAAGRSGIWVKALLASLTHPFGLGFGHVGTTVSDSITWEEYYACENSFLAMALDGGWLFLLLMLGVMGFLLYESRKGVKFYQAAGDDFNERLCRAGMTLMVYLLIVMFFSNHIYDMEAIALIYVYVGLGCYRIHIQSQLFDKIMAKLGTVLTNIAAATAGLFHKRDKRVVLCGAWFGEKFADNSRFLFQYLAAHKDELGLEHVVWAARNEALCECLRGMGYETCLIGTPESDAWHKTAGMHILCNTSTDRDGAVPDIDCRLSHGAVRVNLWHGVGVVKGVGCDSLEYKRRKARNPRVYAIKEWVMKNKLYRLFVQERGGWGDFWFLSPTPLTTKQFSRFSYIPKERFIETAYPRTCPCEQLLDSERAVIERMKQHKGVVLYLPTFRIGATADATAGLSDLVAEELAARDFLWVQKAHSASAVAYDAAAANPQVLNLPSDFDINTIMPYITMLVTDYSSAASDARYFRKPVLFYMPDYEDYRNGANGVTPEADELLDGPQFYTPAAFKEHFATYCDNPARAIRDGYEQIREKYWGQDKTMAEIWQEICLKTGYAKENR